MSHDHPDCPMATSISVSHCDHGHVFIRLHGPDGELIAATSMDAGVADRLADALDEAISAVDAQADEPAEARAH